MSNLVSVPFMKKKTKLVLHTFDKKKKEKKDKQFSRVKIEKSHKHGLEKMDYFTKDK